MSQKKKSENGGVSKKETIKPIVKKHTNLKKEVSKSFIPTADKKPNPIKPKK